MGDLIEFTTRANYEAVFYKITTGALKFSTKSLNGAAAVILSKSPFLNAGYWVVIGQGNSSFILKHEKRMTTASTHNILSGDEYKDFWIAWNNGAIRLGQAESSKPLICHKINERNLFYVAFIGITQESHLKWKIHLPPQIEKPVLLKLTGGEPRWVEPGDTMPDDAIIGGFERELLYIMRGKHEGSLTPGKYVPSEGVGYLSWADQAHVKTEFEVLCGYNYKWIPAQRDKILFGAVLGGYDSRNENLYVGRVKTDKKVIPGKVAPAYKSSFIPYRGREIGFPDYEILVLPYASTHGEDQFYLTNFASLVEEDDSSDESDSL